MPDWQPTIAKFASFPTLLACLAAALLAACASGSEKPAPAPLAPDPGLFKADLAWSSQLGPIDFVLQPRVVGTAVTLASSDGQVANYNAATGAVAWRARVPEALAAGVGGDGRVFAVISSGNELVAFDATRELWRQRLAASSYTPPLVAGARVFVLTADRSVLAFDGQTGRELWKIQRPSESLVLRQMGVLLPVGNTLVVGLSGQLVGLNPNSGEQLWSTAIAAPRGANEVERLVDLVGPAQRWGSVVCVRAFQAAIGCVDASSGQLLWRQAAVGGQGLAGDDNLIYATESNGKVLAFDRADGKPVWSTQALQFRDLSAPLVLGNAVLVGDEGGLIHLLSRANGSLLARLATDGTAIAAPPVLAEDMLVVATRGGGVFAFRPRLH